MNKSLDAVVLRYVGYGALFLVLLYALFMVRGVLPIFAVALMLAYAFEPMLRRMEKGGRSRASAVGFVAFLFLLLFALMLALLAAAWQQIQALSSNFPTYQNQVNAFITQTQPRVESLRLPENVKKSALDAINDFQNRVPSMLGARLQGVVGWIFSSLGTIGIAMIIVPILTLYFMMEMSALRGRSLMIVPSVYRRDVIEIADSINELLGRYVRGQLIVCGTFGLLCTGLFYILSFRYGMDYPLILGLAAGFIYIVPYVGMLSIGVSAALTAYFTSETAPALCAGIAVGGVVLCNLCIDYGLAPRVLGRGVGLHPLLVIFALLSGAQVGGIMGMILAVPVFASLRVVLIYLFPQLVAPLPEENAPTPTTNAQAKAVEDANIAEKSAPTRRGIFAWLKRAKT